MARESEAKFLELARKRFTLASEADEKQRSRERTDLRNYALGPWSDDDLKARQAQPATNSGLPPVPARPTLSIPLVQEPIRQVLNAERGSDLGIELVPADDFAALTGPGDETEIELREGLIRRIQRESEAQDARSWAFARAVIAGRGYYGVMTRYLPGKTWDQEIYIQRYYNQASVSLDPAHEQPDGSDAEWGFIGVDLPWDEYKARYGKRADDSRNRVVSSESEDQFRALMDEAPGWFTSEGDVRMCRVVDYFYTERTARTLCRLADGSSAWEDELPYFHTGEIPAQDKRRVIEKSIKWAQIDGVQILDETDWPGPDLPIVKVLGEELQPFDQERRAQGMVRPAQDSVMGFCAMVSKWVEMIGLSPIPPFQATPDQIEGYQAWYQQANTRALPYLPYNLVSDGGKPLGPPTRTPVDTPIQAIAASVQLFRDAIQSTTGVHDPQLGKVDPSLRSGRAIQALQQQSQHGTSNFLDNLQRSLRYEGQIINNLLPHIYGTPGRIARILSEHGEPQTVQIGPPTGNGNGNAQAQPKQYQLTKDANFNVIVKIAPSVEARRVQEAAMLGDLLSAQPQLMTIFGDLYFKNLDGPGHLEMAERIKVILDPKVQQMLASKQQGGTVPPAVQAQLMQLQQQIQEAEKVMQAQQQELQTRQDEQQIKLQIAQMQADQAIKLQAMRDASAISVAKIAAMTRGIISDNERQVEEIALAQEADRTAAQMQHETRMKGHDVGAEHAHDIASQQADQLHEIATMHLEHQHALEQQQQAADLAPEPAESDTEPEGEPA